MNYIIDRRLNSKKKSTVNRQRFLERYKHHIKKAVADVVNERSITDMERGEKITIPSKDISEPIFHHGEGGKNTRVLPGNDRFNSGDKIKRPQSGGGQGSGGNGASDSCEGEDDFVLQISQEEFLNFMFEDLELPNMVKRQLAGVDEFELKRAGISNEGSPSKVNIIRTLRSANSRRIALTGKKRKQLKHLKIKLEELVSRGCEHSEEAVAIREDIEAINNKIKRVPWLDDFDLKYNLHVKHPNPQSKAVMFCIMDVSGSMDQETQNIAKRFFLLLYLFLQRNYEKIDVVFIRHHTNAKEVNEKEFFYDRETGGTIVSSALHLMNDIIDERYPVTQWNIYGAQASDGDNWNDDYAVCYQLLTERILSKLQYYSYLEITTQDHQSLWYAYEKVLEYFPHAFSKEAVRRRVGYLSGFSTTFSKEDRMSERNSKKRQPISTGSEWTFELLEQYDQEIASIAEEFGLDTYPNQIEVISSEQMMDAYASVGMPISYNHWSYGKKFLNFEQSYKRGQMGLAYEIVINSSPCIAYLMEENTVAMQALVIAHACYGHNSFFKGNYLFRTWTDAESIIDYLVFAKNYIAECEERHGVSSVEAILDSCHAIMNNGVDRYKRPYPLSAVEEAERQKEREKPTCSNK